MTFLTPSYLQGKLPARKMFLTPYQGKQRILRNLLSVIDTRRKLLESKDKDDAPCDLLSFMMKYRDADGIDIVVVIVLVRDIARYIIH